jgi:hypothetical protein
MWKERADVDRGGRTYHASALRELAEAAATLLLGSKRRDPPGDMERWWRRGRHWPWKHKSDKLIENILSAICTVLECRSQLLLHDSLVLLVLEVTGTLDAEFRKLRDCAI